MKKTIAIISLLIAVSVPSVFPVYAMTWMTPSGAVVNDAGQLVSAPPVSFTVKPAITTVTIKLCTVPSKSAIARFFAAITCPKK